jgi:transposase
LALRCQIVLLAGKGWTQKRIAEAVGYSPSGVCRVLQRFREERIAGLVDRREDNGPLKVDEEFLGLLYQLVDDTPQSYGYARPTWTRELLAQVIEELIGVRVHVTTLSRALAQIGARRGRPKPIVGCPWPKQRRKRRLAALQRLVDTAGQQDTVVYVDEVDIHLNPKLGLDWMNRGKQKQVLTPGQNEKCYLAGALNAHTGELSWIGAEQKNSALFIGLLWQLARQYPSGTIHVILDNYKIHKSQQTMTALASFGGRIKLHFLPPYCPDHNRIERVWKDLHDNVTRNHRRQRLVDLVQDIVRYLNDRNRRGAQPLTRIAA